MASLVREPNGRWRLDVICPSGKREHIRLGRTSQRDAKAFKAHVERLCASIRLGEPSDVKTEEWLRGLHDTVHARLASVGLVREREATQLGPWLDKYIAGRSGALKPESLRKLLQTKAKLIGFFGSGRDVRTITQDNAAEWRSELVRQGLSEASAKTHCGNAKTIFRAMECRELIRKSPFREIAGGSTPSTDNRYIGPDVAEAVLGELPDAEWRLLFGLARYAGLRIPSESHLLTWADVEWSRCELRVYSVKTERHAGRERRVVPIQPPLMTLLQNRFDTCAEGVDHLVTKRGGNLDRVVQVAIQRAGIKPWPKLFQMLRSSCETDWKARFPEPFVLLWIGHTEKVSRKHYVNDSRQTPPELWAQVTGQKVVGHTAQNPAQHATELARVGQQNKMPTDAGSSHNPAPVGILSQVLEGQALGGGGNRTPVPR